MGEKIRLGWQLELEGRDADERYGNAPEKHIWQAHVHEEEEKRALRHEQDPSVSCWAEEYAECAMRGVEATANEFQRAEEMGRHGIGEVSGEIANASDLAGG